MNLNGAWEFDVPVAVVPEIKDYDHVSDLPQAHPNIDLDVDIGEEKVEKTYEDYLDEKKAKKENDLADKKLKDAANEEAWNQIEDISEKEEQDEKTDNDSGDSGNPNG